MTVKNKVADIMVTVGVAALAADALGYASNAFAIAESSDDEISAFVVKYPNVATYIDALAKAYGDSTGETFKSNDAIFNKPRRAYRLSISLIAAARSNLNLVEIGTFRSAESVLESVTAATGFCAALDRAQGFAPAFQPAQFVNLIMERLEAKGRSALKGLDGASEDVASTLTREGVEVLAVLMRREVLAKGTKTRDAIPASQIGDTLEACKAIKAENKKAAAEAEKKRLADEAAAEADRLENGVAEQSLANASLALQGDVTESVSSVSSVSAPSSVLSAPSSVSSVLSAPSSVSSVSSVSAPSAVLSAPSAVTSSLSSVSSVLSVATNLALAPEESDELTRQTSLAQFKIDFATAAQNLVRHCKAAGLTRDEVADLWAMAMDSIGLAEKPRGKGKAKGDRETA